MHFMKLPPLLLAVCLSVSASAAEALRGAAAILDEVAAKSGALARQPGAPSPGAQLRGDMTNFAARAATLAPAAAAQEWLALADRFAKLSPQIQFRSEDESAAPPRYPDLLAALPPPAAWGALVKAIAARPAPVALKDVHEFGLRMLGAALGGDHAALAAQVAAFDALAVNAQPRESQRMVQASRMIHDVLLALSDDARTILAGVERQIADAEGEPTYGQHTINLPDLVGLLGEADATPLLERAIQSKAGVISIRGTATAALAGRLALKLVGELSVPRWELVNSPDAVELYEALDKKFADAKPARANPAQPSRPTTSTASTNSAISWKCS